MNNFFREWAKSVDSPIEFDTDVFELTPEERLDVYGVDPVETLGSMSPEDRIERYGRDYSEYFE